MSGTVFFETGTHHVLCKIEGLDPSEFPYPKSFQNCWDRHHVRLPCSTQVPPSATSSASTASWSEIVQGLTTPITNSQELSKMMALWNEGEDSGWNTNALDAFLNQKADRSTPTSIHNAHRHEYDSPLENRDIDGDFSMDETPRSDHDYDSSNNFYHNEDAAEDQFLNKEERDRFFKVILPKMQELALRLPELVMKPIPFLKQQQDAAITLSQEQIACLLANAFFCTFPCRNAPDRRQSNTKNDKKRPFSGPASSRGDKRDGASIHHTNTSGRTLGESPKDRYGAAGKAGPPSRDPFRNANGQMSLFAYFNKKDPTVDSTASAASRTRVTVPIAPKALGKNASSNSTNRSNKSSGNYHNNINNNSTSASANRGMPQGTVTFHRQVMKNTVTLADHERLNKDSFRYVQVQVDVDNPLEDEAPLGALQLDFANKTLGGGVLGRGAVQEEIRFVICPELIISRLFTQQLQDNEAVLIKGAERYSNYNGYSRTFEWHSDYVDATPRDKLGRRKTEICAIDALPFKFKDQRLDQFSEKCILREINKAIVGFRRSAITASEWGLCRAESPTGESQLIATGNWGCGAFGGHLQLKFLIQLLAASVCGGYSKDDRDDNLPMGRNLIYYTYGLDDLAKEIETFMSHLHRSPKVFNPCKL
ncbi:hypothetical protein BGZ51_003618 [Haplosporangium sp. Z 767]|nr:hypothetical protein BGZ51_003618 [Haplosporangium sp. Z 767]KAF9195929.1 hypothetical protein BGZ50_002958 [Haplosporangium sp. Z 11]